MTNWLRTVVIVLMSLFLYEMFRQCYLRKDSKPLVKSAILPNNLLLDRALYLQGQLTMASKLLADRLLKHSGTMEDFYYFLSLLDDNCTNMLFPNAQPLLDAHHFKILQEDFNSKLKSAPKVTEGFSGQVRGQTVFYVLLARQPWVRQVCEIGFNAGHSALYWLGSSNRTRLLSFDLGIHDYAKVMANYIMTKYPGRFQIIWGDSTKTVPSTVKNLIQSGFFGGCDVIVVDGGHTYDVAISDLRNMQLFATSQRHLLIVDDTPCAASYCTGPAKALKDLQDDVRLLYGCSTYPNFDRGFTVGYYVMKKS